MHILWGFSIVTTTESKFTVRNKEQKQIEFDSKERIENEVRRARGVLSVRVDIGQKSDTGNI